LSAFKNCKGIGNIKMYCNILDVSDYDRWTVIR
jgi:hypothetical protein